MKIIYIPRNSIIKFTSVFLIVLVSLIYSFGGGIQSLNVFLNTQKEIPIYSVDTKDKRIALTFDVSFGTDYTDQIVRILKKNNVKATFFVVGEWAEKNPQRMKMIFKDGHEIGNHSYSHADLTELNKAGVKEEVLKTSEIINKITGVNTNIFRVPFGDYNTDLIRMINNENNYCIEWDVDSMDMKNIGAQMVYSNVVSNIDNGSIVLFHNNADQTPVALDKIIRELKTKGYSFVKVSDLIFKKDFYIDHTGRQKSIK